MKDEEVVTCGVHVLRQIPQVSKLSLCGCCHASRKKRDGMLTIGSSGTNSGEPSGSREGSAPPQDEYAGEPSKKVRAVRVGDKQYYVAEDSPDDWLHNVSLDEQFLEHDLPDFNSEHDLKPLWDWGSEEQGPPVLGEEEMEQVEQQSDLRRLLQMSVLKPVDFEPLLTRP